MLFSEDSTLYTNQIKSPSIFSYLDNFKLIFLLYFYLFKDKKYNY